MSITKCENLSLGIFINLREGFQSIWIKVTGPCQLVSSIFPFLVTIFSLILIGMCHVVKFYWLKWHLLLDFHWFFNCRICFIWLQAPGNRTGQSFGVTIAKLSYKYGLLRTNQIQAFCYWHISREDKGDREGIPHTHPTPYIGNSSQVIFRIGIKLPRALRGYFVEVSHD